MSVEELQKQILELKTENEELKRKVDEFEIPRVGKFRPFEIESQALRTRIEELERENENLKTADSSKRIFKVETPHPDLTKIITEKNKLEIQVRDLTLELNDLRARSSALERLSETQSEITETNPLFKLSASPPPQPSEDLVAKFEELKKKLQNETKSSVTNIQAQLNQEREIRKSLEVTNAKLVKEIETANVAFKKLNEDAEDAVNKLKARLEEEHQKRQKAEADIKGALDRADKIKAESDLRIDEQKKMSQNLVKDINMKLMQAQADVKRLEQHVKDLQVPKV